MKKVLCFILGVALLPAFAQQPDPQENKGQSKRVFAYDNDLLSKEFHKGRREALRALMPDSSVAVIFANPVRNRSNDVNFEYHQNPDLYYLTGLTEPNAMLLVFKEERQVDTTLTNEVLFMQPRDESREIWDGKRLGTTGAKEFLGIKEAFENHEFRDFPLDFSSFKSILYITPLNDVRDNSRDEGDLHSLVKHFKSKIDTLPSEVDPRKLLEMMAILRQDKQPDELKLMQKAIDITCQAQLELMQTLDSNHAEYHAEAVIEYVFKREGAEYPGFPSIVGGGENSCILHYVTNRKPLTANDMLVVDVGAEYHGYTADVTRTMPVNGKFSKEQAAIYNIVLKAQQAGIDTSKKGNKFWDPGIAAKEVIQKGLMELGIINDPSEVTKYFMHGTSHYLGLDVHDVGLYGQLDPGQVITVEPGIYIAEGSDCDAKWWNIGVRIEDDVLITDSEPEVMSSCVPKTIEEIEALMNADGLLQHSTTK